MIGTLLRRLFAKRPPELLPVGSQAPDFRLSDHLGRTHSLSHYRGRRIVLWFYPKASTPG
jgi:thioredoxin-dependent peroxiredoxin